MVSRLETLFCPIQRYHNLNMTVKETSMVLEAYSRCIYLPSTQMSYSSDQVLMLVYACKSRITEWMDSNRVSETTS